MRLLPLIYGASVLPLSAAYMADFNTPGQLAADFTTAQTSGPVSQSTTGGLNNGGAVNLSGLASNVDQIYTLNQAFAGNLPSWSASLFYRGNAQNFGGFGLVGQAAPAVVDGTPAQGANYLPHFYVQSGSADGGALGIGNYVQSTNDGTFSTLADIPGGLSTANNWYRYSMNVTYLGASSYSVQATLSAADSTGTVGATLATANFTFSNPDLAADPSVYLFFNMYDGQAIDNFSTTAVPEPGVAMAGAAALAMAAFRRRRCRG